MDDKDALELLDAHLDHEPLTPEQEQALRQWLIEHPEHADRAFHRIFLHSFLRERLQQPSLPSLESKTASFPDDLSLGLSPTDTANLITQDPLPHPQQYIHPIRRILSVGMVFGLVAAGLWLGWRSLPPGGKPVQAPWSYEGFAYSETSPAVPLGDSKKWPTSGGLQGLDGGSGWAEPWQEAGPKVAVLVADVQANAWRASDMRKTGPLGYTDRHRQTLSSTGIQLRSAAGSSSDTSRRLQLQNFPKHTIDESGLGRDASVIWLSFLAQSFDGRGLDNYAYLQFGPDKAGFRVGKLSAVPSGNWSACGVTNGTETNARSSDIPSSQAVLFVIRFVFRVGGDEADVWIDPPLESRSLSSLTPIHIVLPDIHADRIAIKSRYSTDFDEIRVGGSFDSVTPIR